MIQGPSGCGVVPDSSGGFPVLILYYFVSKPADLLFQLAIGSNALKGLVTLPRLRFCDKIRMSGWKPGL